ncbi:hypothetical protein KW850_25730 [Bacillus sp. sid0103]|uniref:hypothetical protein n=1 Tax=Bacillus sp. sid0103 TaxID=2856337 RepID=UPI001C44BFA0|nr:hypothetical protein [Bacillus sp. sid0103]MBV7508621.1 hypothetical protein [Bacillus sp. sid0103]
MKTVFGFIDRIDGRKRTFLGVLANVQNNKLIDIKNPYEEFPNNGKIFVPFPSEEMYNGKLGFFILTESGTYNSDIPSSSKYIVSHEAPHIGYFEVVESDYNFLTQQQEIVNIIQKGIMPSFNFTSKILLSTQDDYLIGPFSVKLNKDNKWVGQVDDTGIIEVRRNKEYFIKYQDFNSGVYRYFISTEITNSPVDNYLDCASDERIVREALKILKEEKKFQEISRAVIKNLADLVNELPPIVKKGRIYKAINLLQSHSISEESIDIFDSELIQYDVVESRINKKVEEALEEEKKKLEDKHRKIINETKQLITLKEKLQTDVKIIKEKQDKADIDLKKANDALQQKLKEMQENVYRTLVNLLPNSNVLSNVKVNTNSLNEPPSQWFVQEKEEKETLIMEINTLLDHLIRNLEHIGVEKEARFIAFTVIGAILFRKPIIIKGENGFDIAQTIGWSISGNDHLTIFPEIHGYSNDSLISCFQDYKRLESVKSLHVSSIENSSAELFLPSFVDYWTVSTNKLYPDLLLISAKDIEEISDSFLSKLKYSPVINTDNFGSKGRLRKARLQGNITFGFTLLEIFDESLWVKKKSKSFKEFKQVLEETIKLKPSRISNDFKDWFCLFENNDFEEEELTKWLVQIFLQDYIDSDKFNEIIEELIIEELQNV